jgi:Lrp/AsnC family transcriptional regulator, leucine-responsive regulatory protein
MDAVDRALLDALRANGRATFTELAREVGLSAPTVHERVGKLEAAGVITGYHAVVAPEALGYLMGAIISVFMNGAAAPGQTPLQSNDTVEDAVAAIDAVEDCWFVAGEEALIIKVRVPDVGALEQVIRQLNDIPGVGHTKTTVVLSTRFEGRVRTAHLPEPDDA